MPDVNLEQRIFSGETSVFGTRRNNIFWYKKNRLCSNHPHNYYLEILTETGAVGLIIIFYNCFVIYKSFYLKIINF